MAYYNSVPLSMKDKRRAEKLCNEEEQVILGFFDDNHSRAMSPCDVWMELFKGHMVQNHKKKPLTNVRRAITDLTDKGYLEKVGHKIGYFGRKVNTWQLKSKN